MAVKKISSTKTSTTTKSAPAASGVKAATKETIKVEANPRLVSALQNYDEAKSQAKSYLITVATIAQEEQLTKEEIIVSMMEARGIDRDTAKQQYARISRLLLDPKTLEELREGVIDLATARAKTVVKQKNPSAKKKQENAEKAMLNGMTRVISAAKEIGLDIDGVIRMFKEAAKKAGLK